MIRSLRVVALVLDVVTISASIVVITRLREAKKQAWFWTPDWMVGELEASSDIAAGRVDRFTDDESFFKFVETAPSNHDEAWASA